MHDVASSVPTIFLSCWQTPAVMRRRIYNNYTISHPTITGANQYSSTSLVTASRPCWWILRCDGFLWWIYAPVLSLWKQHYRPAWPEQCKMETPAYSGHTVPTPWEKKKLRRCRPKGRKTAAKWGGNRPFGKGRRIWGKYWKIRSEFSARNKELTEKFVKYVKNIRKCIKAK